MIHVYLPIMWFKYVAVNVSQMTISEVFIKPTTHVFKCFCCVYVCIKPVMWISGGFLCVCVDVSRQVFDGGLEGKESRIVKLSFSGT